MNKVDRYENMSFDASQENPYDVLGMTDQAGCSKPKTTSAIFMKTEESNTEMKSIQEKNASSLLLTRLLVIFVFIILVIGLAAMTTLYFIEKNKYEDQQNSLKHQTQEHYEQLTGSRGRTFLVSFIISHVATNDTNRTIFVSSENDFNITVTLSQRLNSNLISITDVRTQNVTLKKINVHYSMVPSSLSIEYKAILINTSSLTSVFSISNLMYSSDSTTVFPIDKLSTSYIISMSTPLKRYTGSGSYFTAVSSADNTNISITLSIDRDITIQLDGKQYGNGDNFNVVLNEYQTFQVGLEGDLSGTTIKSSHAIAVFAGNRCNKLGDYGACSMLMEMVPPIDKLDNAFIVPPNLHRYISQVRIMAPTETSVTYSVEGNKTSVILSETQKNDFIIRENETATIYSIEPLLVNSFAYGSIQKDLYGDPYMITIPGIHQYINEYNLIVPEHFNFSFVTFILRTDSLGNLRINETSINEDKCCFFSTVSVDNSFYSVLTLDIPSGVMKVRTTDGTPFGVMIYGQRDNDGHGYTGNAILASCKKGWIQVENFCYFISRNKVTFKDALKICKDERGSLTKHLTAKLQRVVDLKLKVMRDVGIWIAATDIKEEGKYVYVTDGSKVISNNWAKGQPRGGKNFNCVAARKDDNWKWYDYPCDHTFYYVCRKPL